MKSYSTKEIEESLGKVNNWKFENDCIVKNFQFKNFSEALAFIVRVGILAEKINHHPNIQNVYNKVTLMLNTHDVNGITEKDFELAESIDNL